MRHHLAILLLLPALAPAATKRWTGGGANDRWSTAQNWSPAGAPVNQDHVIISDNLSAALDYVTAQNDIAGLTLGSVTLNYGKITGVEFTVANTLTIEQSGYDIASVIEAQVKLGGAAGERLFTVAERAVIHRINLNGHALRMELSRENGYDTEVREISGSDDVTFAAVAGPALSNSTLILNNARTAGRMFLDGVVLELRTSKTANAPELGGDFTVGGHGRATKLWAIGKEPLTAGSIVRVRSGGLFNVSGEFPDHPGTVPAVELHDDSELKCSNHLHFPAGLTVKAGAQAEIRGTVVRLAFPTGVPLTLEPGSVTEFEGALADQTGPGGTVRITGGGRLELSSTDSSHLCKNVDLDGTEMAMPRRKDFALTNIGLGVPIFTVRNGGALEFNPEEEGLNTVIPYITLNNGTFRCTGSVRLEAADGAGLALAGGNSRIEAGGDLNLRCRISGPGGVIYDATSIELRNDAVISHSASTTAPDHDGLTYTGSTDFRLQQCRYAFVAGSYLQPGAGGALFFGAPNAVQTLVMESQQIYVARDITVRANTTVIASAGLEALLLKLNGGSIVRASVEAERVELADNPLAPPAALISGALTLSESINTGGAGNVLVHQGALRGTGTINKLGGGLLRLGGAQAGTFTGTVRIAAGSVDFEKSAGSPAFGDAAVIIGDNTGIPVFVRCLTSGQLHAGHALELKTGATLDYSPVVASRAETIGSLAASGGLLRLPAAGLACGMNNATTTCAARLTGGGGGFIKAGAGALTLSGTCDYTGATLVTEGALMVTGSIAGTGVEVLDEGTLSGTGMLPAVTIRSGATLQPGNPAGGLRTGNLLMENGARFTSVITGTAAAPVIGSVTVNGTVSLGGTVFGLTQSITPQTGSVLRFVDNNLTDAITGTFAGLAQGTAWSSNNLDFTASYTSGTGNDFALTFTGTNSNPTGQPPAMPTPAAVTVNETTEAIVQFQATDPDPAQTIVYSLVTPAPAGAVIDAQNGRLRFLTKEVQGGTTVQVAVRATDSGSPPQSATATATIHVTDTNVAPYADYFTGDPMAEGLPIVIETQNSHSDPDLPLQTLIYTLNAPAPAGMTINPSTGYLTWAPTEAQGGTSVPVSVTVTDNGTPPLSHTTNFSLFPLEANARPVLPAYASPYHVTEGSLFTLDLAATDADLPAQPLTHTLNNATQNNPDITNIPALNATTGRFTWRSAESDPAGPHTFFFTVSDTAGGTSYGSFTVIVDKGNKTPVITPVGDRTARPGYEMNFRIYATDADLPAQTLTWSLATPAPPGLTLDSETGRMKWTPTAGQSPQIYPLTVRVTDNGTAAAFAEISIRIWVRDARPRLPDLSIEPRPTAGGIRLRFTLPADTLYEIQSTQNVEGAWFPRGTFTAPGGEILWIDNPASPPVRRYYRLYAP